MTYRAHRTRQHIEFLASLMENSAYGGLSQVFIFHAIATVANAVSKKDLSHFKSDDASGEDWTGVARETRDKLEIYLDGKLEYFRTI